MVLFSMKLLILLIAFVLSSPVAAQNVLVVVLDDVGVDLVSTYGEHSDAAPTPTLDSLAEQGAVSEEVVQQMALGAMQRSGADYAIAVSGIAGPDGGTVEKPVGTVWLAWGDRGHIRTRSLCWPVERSLFQTMIAAAGLDMIRRILLGIEEEPRYFTQRRAK